MLETALADWKREFPQDWKVNHRICGENGVKDKSG